MSILSISIVESEEEIVSGLPRNIQISSNLPANIFYTFDGTNPTLFSQIYLGGNLPLPTDKPSLTVKIMATNGIDSSPIISQTYLSKNFSENVRFHRSTTTQPAQESIPSLFPFGTQASIANYEYVQKAGITVNDPNLPQIIDGYGADGNPNSFSNQPYNLENYSIVYTTTDSIGAPSVGNLPANVKIEIPTDPPEESIIDNLFDPRAMVIFQDVVNEDPSNPPMINRQFFSLENPETVKDGSYFYPNGNGDFTINKGSFVGSFFNPRENTMTYYYMDSSVNRWIISKTPYKPTTLNLASLPVQRGGGLGKIFEWMPYPRRVLF